MFSSEQLLFQMEVFYTEVLVVCELPDPLRSGDTSQTGRAPRVRFNGQLWSQASPCTVSWFLQSTGL